MPYWNYSTPQTCRFPVRLSYALYRSFLGFCWVCTDPLRHLLAPKDIQDWKDAAQPWKRMLAMFDQNSALWIFACLCLAYIGWIEIRPAIKRFLGKDGRRNARREKLFEITAKERFDLAKRIMGMSVDGASKYKTIKRLNVEFDDLNREAEVFLGVGDLHVYLDHFEGGFRGAWAAEFRGSKAGLSFNECDLLAQHFGTTAKIAAIFASQWLQGEEPDLNEFLHLIEMKEMAPNDGVAEASEKLGKFCDLDLGSDEIPRGAVIRSYRLQPNIEEKTPPKNRPD